MSKKPDFYKNGKKSTIKLKYYYQNHHTSFVFLLRKSVFCLFFSYNLFELYSYLLLLAVL